MRTEVRTQAELDAALKKATTGEIIAIRGDGYFRVDDSNLGGSATVRAWGSATVEAGGSATVEAGGSATVRAWDRATVRAWGSATVEAGGSATVEAWGSATVEATPWCAVHRASPDATITGGVIIEPPVLDNARTWCEYHGVEIPDGDDPVVVLYKVVDDQWRSGYSTPKGERIIYAPGETPEAPDWDGGAAECGGGLHFAPNVWRALEWDRSAAKIVGCPVRMADVVVHADASMPWKVKAPRVVAPGCFEVDRAGERVESEAVSS